MLFSSAAKLFFGSKIYRSNAPSVDVLPTLEIKKHAYPSQYVSGAEAFFSILILNRSSRFFPNVQLLDDCGISAEQDIVRSAFTYSEHSARLTSIDFGGMQDMPLKAIAGSQGISFYFDIHPRSTLFLTYTMSLSAASPLKNTVITTTVSLNAQSIAIPIKTVCTMPINQTANFKHICIKHKNVLHPCQHVIIRGYVKPSK